MTRQSTDAVNHWDLPVTEFKPRLAMVRVLSVVERNADPTDPAVEALMILRREQVTVYDFYRCRPRRETHVADFNPKETRS